MRGSRPRYPKERHVAAVRAALAAIPSDSPPREGWRESARSVPNWRFAGAAEGVEWVVDVYCGGWCWARVGGSSERTRSLLALAGFLVAHLAARGVEET
jgi:hypothetical protein